MRINSILMVCIGNICRSPSAEFICRARLGDSQVKVESAGLAAVVGADIESHAKQLLLDNNIACPVHQARQVSSELLQQYDLILAMEPEHVSALKSMCPQASGKIFLLGKWQQDASIPDPYMRGSAAFASAYELIFAGVDAWLSRLNLR